MKDFWKFFGKLVLAITLVVLVVVLIKKFKPTDSVEHDSNERVYVYPGGGKQLWMKMDYSSDGRTLQTNKNISIQLEKTVANLAEDLKRMEEKVNSQGRTVNRAISQANENISALKETLNSLNISAFKSNGKKDGSETSNSRIKEEFRFPFAPLDNSCYEPFNLQKPANGMKENQSRNAQPQTVIKPSSPTKGPEDTNNLSDNKLTDATCALIIRNPSIPLDSKFNLRKPNENYRISLAGFIPSRSTEFIIDICIDTKIVLHINPRFGDSKIVLNTFDTNWNEKEENTTLSGMDPGNKFQIVITYEDPIFQIEVNNGDVTLFQNRINDTVSISRHVRIRGDVVPSLLTYEFLHDPESATNSTVSNDLLSFPFML